MEDIGGLFNLKQLSFWKCLSTNNSNSNNKSCRSKSYDCCSWIKTIGGFADRHWPTICLGFGRLWRFAWTLVVYWKCCVLRGFHSLVALGSAALLLIIWSCFLSLTSLSCLLYLLLSMVCTLYYVLCNQSLLFSFTWPCIHKHIVRFSM